MALANVTQEISRDADAKAAALKAEADAEVAKITADAEAKIAELKEKEDKRLKEAIERLERQELSSAELESKKIVLAKKKEILAQTFDSMLADLEGASAAEKLTQYKAMVKVAKGIIDYDSTDLKMIKGKHSDEIEFILGYKAHDDAVISENIALI